MRMNCTGKGFDGLEMQEEARRQVGRAGGGGRGNAFEQGKQEEEAYAQHQWGKKAGGGGAGSDGEEEEVQKEEKSFGLSGLLAAETRTWQGIELKFIEPPEARMPDKMWRLYEFKGDDQVRCGRLCRFKGSGQVQGGLVVCERGGGAKAARSRWGVELGWETGHEGGEWCCRRAKLCGARFCLC